MRIQNISRYLIIGVAISLIAGFAAGARAQQQESGGPDKEVLQLFEEGISLYEEGKLAEARDVFDVALWVGGSF